MLVTLRILRAVPDNPSGLIHVPDLESPGADTGALISDAQVAETSYTLHLGRGRALTVRLVVRRVRDARYPDALFPVWRYHPFVTNSALPVDEADLTHRRHAIIETTFADRIDGPLAHIPSGLFAANCCVIGPIPVVMAKGSFRFSWRNQEPYGCPSYEARLVFPGAPH